ncbi:flavin reductase family protein [Dactylosporangium sp. CA-052675]|uniref:flavin reductase family protein n=1 Tax=Dactylosporangium sp. CA-052675 TaxID=3239927 RepID=UPI003D8C978F
MSGHDPALEADFRHVLGHFATGLSVLTADAGAGPVGMTVQALMSLSLAPPLIALGIDRRSRTWPQIRRAGRFCVNLLRVEQEELAWRLGRSDTGKFDGVGLRAGREGRPELPEAIAWIGCAVRAEHDGGDHWLVVAEVDELRLGSGEPLIFHRGRAGRLML